MLRPYQESFKVIYTEKANLMLRLLSFIPGLGGIIRSRYFENNKSKKGMMIAAAVCTLIFAMIKCMALVLLFCVLPQQVFSSRMSAGVAGFSKDNSFTYFSIIMFCYCGSLINSRLFNGDTISFVLLKEMWIEPKVYFRTIVLKKAVEQLIGFHFALILCGMNPGKAMFLTIVIVISSFIGETLNMLFFRMTSKIIIEMRGLNEFIMLLSLFVAYFIPYLRGCVPDAYNLIFNSTWLIVVVAAASFFIYYVWNYGGYDKIAVRVFRKYAFVDDSDRNNKKSEPDFYEKEELLIDETDKNSHNLTGYKYVNWLFFKRNKSKIVSGIIGRIVVVIGILLAIFLAGRLGRADIIGRVISLSLPLMAIVMYLMSNGRRICRDMFFYCDFSLFRMPAYKKQEAVLDTFLIRLRYLMLIDMFHTVALVIVFIIGGMFAGGEVSMKTVLLCCLGIVLYSMIYSVFNLLIYYVFQPYDRECELKGKAYIACRCMIYLFCYGVMYINISNTFFLLMQVLILALMLAGGVSLVGKKHLRGFNFKS